MYCSACGVELESSARFCRRCGAASAASPSEGISEVRLGLEHARNEEYDKAEPLLQRGLASLGGADTALALEAFGVLMEIYLVRNARPQIEALGRRYPALLAQYAGE
jgi:hypothetical protein